MGKFFINLMAIGLTCVILAGFAGFYLIYHYSRGLPDFEQLKQYEPPVVTRLYATDGRILAEYATEKRVYVPITAMPKRLLQAFISAEDRNFYQHPGVDIIGIGRAVVTNLSNLGSDHSLVGGSTITQQVVKNFLLTNEKSLERKIREAILSFRITNALPKDRVLELYLNEIYLGFGSYGVAAAALNYFNKSINELTVEEAAFLASLPKAPARYNPHRHYERAKARRDWVISRMVEDGYITKEKGERAQKKPILVRQRDEAETVPEDIADFFAEEVRRELVERYGAESLYEGGMVVHTTLDPEIQKVAQDAFRAGVMGYDQRHGYRGPVATLESTEDWLGKLVTHAPDDLPPTWLTAVVLEVGDTSARIGFADSTETDIGFEGMSWARRDLGKSFGPEVHKPADVVATGDIILVEPQTAGEGDDAKTTYILRQKPKVNGGMAVIDPHTGRVLALVGGFSPKGTEFNRATQAKRQPGSAFKPFVYLAALESGFSPISIIMDAPIELPQGPGLPMWRPQNYTDDYLGPTTMRVGVEKSRNAMTVRLAQMIGLPRVMEIGIRFGIYDKLPRNFSMVLGAQETTVLRLTSAYAQLVNGGKKIEPAIIERIQDRYGRTIYRRDTRDCPSCREDDPATLGMLSPPAIEDNRPQIVDPAVAYQLVSILEGVVQRGTGRKALEVDYPLAGKTGTTNDSRDAWFVGFSPDLVAGVYLGFDQPRTLGRKETGGATALPVFVEFMKEALEGQPKTPFRIPPGVMLRKVEASTGRAPGPGTPASQVILEAFRTNPVMSFYESDRAGKGRNDQEPGTATATVPAWNEDPYAVPGADGYDAAPEGNTATDTPDVGIGGLY